MTREHRDRRALSIKSREETERAEVRATPRTWSPKLEVDGVAIPYTASVLLRFESTTGAERDI